MKFLTLISTGAILMGTAFQVSSVHAQTSEVEMVPSSDAEMIYVQGTDAEELAAALPGLWVDVPARDAQISSKTFSTTSGALKIVCRDVISAKAGSTGSTQDCKITKVSR